MRKRALSKLFMVLCLSITINSAGICGNGQEGNYVPNEILVRFQEGIGQAEKDTVRENLGAQLIRTIKSIRVEYWRLPEDISTEEAIDILKQVPSVEHSEPNHLYELQRAPNDPLLSKLWYLNNTGQNVNGIVGTPGADISVFDAWNIETGTQSIVIAVVDTGVAFDHPDLQNNTWTNINEIAGNGIDDDENGYIDDVHGWDFVNSENNPSDYSRDLYGDGHGTHVAGTIAAQGNNGIGVTGVLWNAQIMPLQVFDLFNAGSFLDGISQSINIISAIEYATDNGAKIINLSLGSPTYNQFQQDVLSYANSKAVLVVASAGNSSADSDFSPNYPASYNLPNIISVAATDQNDALASYSNYGVSTVDIAAPGGSGVKANVYNTIPPDRVTLFFDDFESGGGKWLTSGIFNLWSLTYNFVFASNVIQDSAGYYYANENSHVTTAAPIDTTDCRGVHLQFQIDHSLEYGYDFLHLEGSLDGINYSNFYSFTGFSYGIGEYNAWWGDMGPENLYLRFRLVTDWSNNYDGIFIDNIYVTGIPWSFSGNEYGYKSGTSMAAPVVSGVAGLIWSHKPSLTHLEVKNIVLNSVDKLSSLNGKVLTGGRVNAYRALLETNPTPSPSTIIPAIILLLQ